MKGSIRDLGVILIFSTVFIVCALMVAVFYFNLKSAITPNVDPTNATGPLFQRGDQVIGNFVNLGAVVIILMGVAAIVLAFFIPSHPIFLPITFIVWIFYTLLAVGFSNMLWEFINSSVVIGVANQYPIMVYIIRYLPHIISVIGAIIMIVMYSKRGID